MGRRALLVMGAWFLAMAGSASAQGVVAFQPFTAPAYRPVNSIAFSPDGSTMYLALLHREVLASQGLDASSAPETALYESRLADGVWQAPQLMPFSGRFKDYEPAVSADGSLMVFNSQRPYDDGRIPTANDLWMVERQGAGWGTPQRIEALSSFENEESYGTLMANRTLVFLAGRPESAGGTAFDLYLSEYADGEFQPATRHPVSRDEWGEGDPWIASDGSYLIFTRWDEVVGWSESVDLYISFQEDGSWTEPLALGALNTPGPDFGPAVSPDGELLYYKNGSQFLRANLSDVLRGHQPNPG